MLIAIVGMPGAGKTEAASFFRDKLKFAYLRFGEVVEEGLRRESRQINEQNEREYRERLRQRLGMEAVAVKLEPMIREVQKREKRIVLDGLYSWEEYEYLKERYAELILVCIYATPKTRYQRLGLRPHRSLSEKEARLRDISELRQLNKGTAIALADFLVVNEGKLEELQVSLKRIYGQIEQGRYYREK